MNSPHISRVFRSSRQARASYDRLSRWYDLLAGDFERRPRQAALRMLDLRAGEVVLEIGPGTGRSLVTLAGSVGGSGRVCGIDLSRGMLDVARARVERAGLAARIDLQQGDALHLPFTAGCFDCVFISFTLELFDTPEMPLVLDECARTLRRDGRISVLGLSKEGGTNAITRLYEWLHLKLPQVADCRPIFVRRLLQDSGFHVLEAAEFSLAGLPCQAVLAQVP